MERFVRVPCGLYQGYGNTMPLGQPGLYEHKQPDWRRNAGPPTFLARPGLLVPANASDYCMDPYKRAQLKAILSQMNPSLSLRLCKANTKEVGVQVSPRVDKSVQCSLGSRTLRSRSPWSRSGHKVPLPAWGVYSPVIGRRGLIQPRKEGEDQERKALLGPAEASQQQQQSPPTPRSEEDKQEELCQHGLGEEGTPSPQEGKSKQTQGVGGADLLRKPNFQVYFKQLCCKCQKSFNPYRVEAIQCQTCSKSRCSCPQKKRHIDLRRPHRQELCGRCKDKRFSCGNTYSFKYIM
ncbi:ZAR1-like protein isoform X2 [Panthera pardus]|uniref:ZAR1-like protein isoform X2 n=1 Tax=Panthera pardus TaxID=9691 RepID=A0A9V1FI87_PANPR|nr:ZAR1-like protein isoform X2 [Panthera pardus]